MSKQFLLTHQIQHNFRRWVTQHNKKHIYKKVGNVKYFDGIAYYPNDKNEVEPEVTNPPKLFRVQRIKPVANTPFWERRILKEFGLIYSAGKDIAIVKNLPENNTRLWKIKHLVSIEPIEFTYGEPSQDDINYTYLKENGECIVTKEIAVDEKRLAATEEFINDPKRLDKDTLKRDALMKWVKHQC